MLITILIKKMHFSTKNTIKTRILQKKQINTKQILLNEMLKKNNREIEDDLSNLSDENKTLILKKKNVKIKNDYCEENSTLENIKRYIYERVCKKYSSDEKKILPFLIDRIDSNGFLKENVDILKSEIFLHFGLRKSNEEIERYITELKKIFPYGIGSRDEKEFKLWQIKRLKGEIILSEEILDFSLTHRKKKYKELLKIYSDNDIKKTYKIYSQLKNSPVDFFKSEENDYNFSVDFFVHQENDDEFSVRVKEIDLPKFTFNENTLSENCDEKYIEYMKKRREFLRNIYDNIRKRNEYLRKLIEGIVKLQKQFFLTGNFKLLSPMTYNILSVETGMSVSTISRVVLNKRVQTDFGVFQLKTLFSKNIKSNKKISVISVLFKIQEIIEKNNNIADSEITDVLRSKGINIERRTVSNYRKKLGIANSFEREMIAFFEK